MYSQSLGRIGEQVEPRARLPRSQEQIWATLQETEEYRMAKLAARMKRVDPAAEARRLSYEQGATARVALDGAQVQVPEVIAPAPQPTFVETLAA